MGTHHTRFHLFSFSTGHVKNNLIRCIGHKKRNFTSNQVMYFSMSKFICYKLNVEYELEIIIR